MTENELHPNKSEQQFLSQAYNRFYDLYEKIIDKSFWDKEDSLCYLEIKECFLIYTELLNYEPIKWSLEHINKTRPPMEGKIGKEYFSFIRNLLVHFPLFSKWEEVCFNRDLINWHHHGKTIDRFLCAYEGHEPVKYRMWNYRTKEFTYVTISFPKEYKRNHTVYLSGLLPEKEGIMFSISFMKHILDVQVESI